jgi:beta-glucosidase
MWRARCSRILLTLFLLVWTTYAQPARRQTELDARVNGLLAKMTLEEKVGQLNLFNVDKTNLGQAVASGKVGSVLNALGAAPWVRSLAHSPLAWMNSPAEITAA